MVPPYTPAVHDYKRMCLYLEERPFLPFPANKPSKYRKVGTSRLLNYWMMRPLDTEYTTRATTQELQRFIPVLGEFADCMIALGQAKILNSFRDSPGVTDSSVVVQMIAPLIHADDTVHLDYRALLRAGNGLVKLLDGMAASEIRRRLYAATGARSLPQCLQAGVPPCKSY